MKTHAHNLSDRSVCITCRHLNTVSLFFLRLTALCAFLFYIFFTELLEQVHAIGKASKNIFSSAQNFSSFSGDEDSSSHSPVISFKAHLIRLIGNLCHSNTNNQNKVCNK